MNIFNDSKIDNPTMVPPMDILESEDEYLVMADLPGVSADDLKLQLDNREVTLDAHFSCEQQGNWVRQEFSAMRYHHTFKVPTDVDVERISVQLNDGVMHMHLPRAAAAKPRLIPVDAA